jgi:hypothetical protein
MHLIDFLLIDIFERNGKCWYDLRLALVVIKAILLNNDSKAFFL